MRLCGRAFMLPCVAIAVRCCFSVLLLPCIAVAVHAVTTLTTVLTAEGLPGDVTMNNFCKTSIQISPSLSLKSLGNLLQQYAEGAILLGPK